MSAFGSTSIDDATILGNRSDKTSQSQTQSSNVQGQTGGNAVVLNMGGSTSAGKGKNTSSSTHYSFGQDAFSTVGEGAFYKSDANVVASGEGAYSFGKNAILQFYGGGNLGSGTSASTSQSTDLQGGSQLSGGIGDLGATATGDGKKLDWKRVIIVGSLVLGAVLIAMSFKKKGKK